MKLELITSTNTAAVSDMWQSLQGSEAQLPLASEWTWVQTWVEVYGKTVPYQFICGYDGSQLVGIGLITKQTGRLLPFPVRSYSVGMGGEPIKDRVQMINNSVLASPAYKQAFAQAVVEYVSAEFLWDELRLDFYQKADVDAFLHAFSCNDLHYTAVSEPTYIFDLHMVREQQAPPITLLGKRTRHEIKRSVTALGGCVSVQFAETINEARDIFADLQQLHQQTWQRRGKRGMFASQLYTRFHTRLIERLFPMGKILLFRVGSRYGTVGCLYGFIEHNNLLGYQSGFRNFGDEKRLAVNPKRIHPGYVTHLLCIETCLYRGLDVYNFGPAEFEYKNHLSTRTEMVWSIRAERSITPQIRDWVWNAYIKADANRLVRLLLRPFYATYLKLTG